MPSTGCWPSCTPSSRWCTSGSSCTRVGSHGLLFHWPGASSDRPVVLMAHLDVVPVDESAPWQHPAFSAEIVDGADLGPRHPRRQGVRRGHLRGGRAAAGGGAPAGAGRLAVLRVRRGGLRPDRRRRRRRAGTPRRTAVARARRGRCDRARGVPRREATGRRDRRRREGHHRESSSGSTGRGGHASTPARNGPTARLARAILKIDRSPMPARLPDTTLDLMQTLAPHAPRPLRPVLGRADRIRPLLTRALTAAGPEAAAMARTTFAITTLDGSPALNVIASSATAGVNIRVMPGDTVADAIAHLRTVIDDDEIEISVVERGEPSPVSPVGRGLRPGRRDDRRAVPRRGPGAVRDDRRDRLPPLHRGSATTSTGSRRSG